MDNSINKTVSAKSIADLEKLILVLEKAEAQMDKTITKADSMMAALSKPPKTSGELNKQLTESDRIIKQLEADNKKLQSSYDGLITKVAKLTEEKKKMSASDRQTVIDNREIRKELDAQAVANSNLTTYLQKLTTERNKSKSAVADYNAQVAMGVAMSKKQQDAYAAEYASFIKLDNAVKAGKTSVRDATENVGHYEKANWGLNNSINQLTRELPAFTFNAQTGFLAISNNIGPLKDSIEAIKKQNAELKIQGQEVKSVGAQLASAFFSWNTLISVGITLVTLYGKEIGIFAKELIGASSALDKIADSQKKYNEARLEGKKDAQTDIIELRKYLAVVKDRNVADDLRQVALKKIRSEYPYYFKNLTDEQILTGKTSAAVKQLIIDLEKRKEVEKKTALNVENKQKLIDLSKELEANEKLLIVATKAKKLVDDRVDKMTASRPILRAERQEQLGAEGDYTRALERRDKTLTQVNAITKNMLKNDEDIFHLKTQTIALEYEDTKAKDENTRAIKLNTKAREDYLASEYELWKIRKTNEANRNKEIMNDEAIGYDLRLAASEQYYQNLIDLANREAKEEIRILDFSTKEKLRTTANQYFNEKEQLDTWLKDGKISREKYNKGLKDAEETLQYNRTGIIQDQTNKQNIIYENQAEKLVQANLEMVDQMRKQWDSINFKKATIQVDERDLEFLEKSGDILNSISPESTAGDIRAKLKDLQILQEEHTRIIKRANLQIEIDSLESSKRRIERDIEEKAKANNLNKEQVEKLKVNNQELLDLDDEIIDKKKEIVNSDNEATRIQLENAAKLKEAKTAAAIELGEALADLANQAFDNASAYYDMEIERSNEHYDALLANAERGSEQEQALMEEKERKEAELQRRKVAIQRKQAIFNKLLSIAEIGMNLQQEIAKNNADLGTIAAQPVNALAIAGAAVRITTVLATPLPQYAKGRKGGKEEMAVVHGQEILEKTDGTIRVAPGKKGTPSITKLDQGENVHKSLEDFTKSKEAIHRAAIMASLGRSNDQLQIFEYQLSREVGRMSDVMEKSIEKGFKKAKINVQNNMPPIDIGHHFYKNKGLT